MRITKNQISNISFVIIFAIIIFTPVGTHLQIWFNRIISFSPKIEDNNSQKNLTDYNWTLVKDNEEKYNLANDKGSLILINYWATWCPPCIAEMPSLNNLYKDYRDKIKFLFITNDTKKNVNTFLNKNEFNFPIFYPISEAPIELQVDRIPTTFLISKNHKIVIEKTGAADWNSSSFREVLDSLLQE